MKPIREFVVNDLDTLKVLADPLRLQIIELMTPAPVTVKQIAADLSLPSTKLYYHIRLLEEHGLIQVVDTRIVSGILEKHYRAAALNYRVNKTLFSPNLPSGKEGLDVMLTGLYDDTREDVHQSIDAGMIDLAAQEEPGHPLNRSLLLARNTLHLTPERAEELYSRMKALIGEYVRDHVNGSAEYPDEHTYGLLVTLYPSVRGPHNPEE
jgi:DNA-binding transcriptional ArsR family regulator